MFPNVGIEIPNLTKILSLLVERSVYILGVGNKSCLRRRLWSVLVVNINIMDI